MKDLELFIPLTKVDAARRLVYGVVTAETPDRGDEICDYDTTKPYYERWSQDFLKASGGKSFGNLRAMHGNVAAGRLEAIRFDDEARQIEICAKVVDDAEWAKVEAGVYTGFSQGGAYVRRWPDESDPRLTRYTANPIEVSLVDLPALPNATFTMIKANGVVERLKFSTRETSALVEQVWRTRDGRTFKKKADALAHQAVAANAGPALEAIERIETDLDRRAADPVRADTLLRLKKALKQDAFDAARAVQAITLVFDVLRSEMAEGETDAEQIAALEEAIGRLRAFILSELGMASAPAPMQQRASSGEFAKMQDALTLATAERDAHKAALEALTPRLEKLAARIEEIGRQPAPAPALTNARTAERSGEAAPEDLAAKLAALSGDERAALLIKVAQSLPQPLR
ncbi:MAG TPA: hypothetical protein VK446_16770 [Methylocystis sp.]|nr:hypothetical protein [Methylocystis sp.]